MKKWEDGLVDYVEEVNAKKSDSAYLREVGLKRTIKSMANDRHFQSLLDIGCGDGWILKELEPASGSEIDIEAPADITTRPNFKLGTASQIPFDDCSFDLIVSSLVLMFVDNIDEATTEMYRVTKPNGRIVIALTSPYFYRTGDVEPDGTFRINVNLNHETKMDIMVGGRVGPFEYFYRPISKYINAFLASGWRLNGIEDWAIDMDDFQKNVDTSNALIKRSALTPLYTFLEFERL